MPDSSPTDTNSAVAADELVTTDWSVIHPYTSFYLAGFDDLEAAARALVASGIAASAYIAGGLAYWRTDGKLKVGAPNLIWREHENHGRMLVPTGADGWAAVGLHDALLHSFSESRLLGPIENELRRYLRANLDPIYLVIGDSALVLQPTLKLYGTGVFSISYLVRSDDHLRVAQLIDDQINLFGRWTDEAWIPEAVVRAGLILGSQSETSFAQVDELLANLTQAAAEKVEIGDFEFKLFPAHLGLSALLVDREDEDEDEDEDEGSAHQSYILADMFHNTEYAVRCVLQESSEVQKSSRLKRLRAGGYWHCRPQVHIFEFEKQPKSAAEIRRRFELDLGRIMARSPLAPLELARSSLGETQRPFDDFSLHIGSAISLCVYGAMADADQEIAPSPADLAATDRAVLFETIDYVSMRCRQLDELATKAKSVEELRTIRTALHSTENLAVTAFRAGELNDAGRNAWSILRLGSIAQTTQKKIEIAVEVFREQADERSSRFNIALTMVFGIVGAAGLTDALTKPLWTYFQLPLPGGLQAPLLFGVSALLVLLCVLGVTKLLGRG